MAKESSLSKLARNAFVNNYKRMWPYVKPYWRQGLLSILLAAFLAVISGCADDTKNASHVLEAVHGFGNDR